MFAQRSVRRYFSSFAGRWRHTAAASNISQRLLHMLKKPQLRAFTITAAATSMFAAQKCYADSLDEKGIAAAVRIADDFYVKNQPSKTMEFLESQLECSCMASPEILWRLARAYYDVAKDLPSKQQQALIDKAFTAISQALEKGDDNSAVHKWYGIILNKVGEFKGTKATIQNSFVVKSHWEKAAALNPHDATSSSLLGEWCFNVAGLSSVTRAIASAIFASPPSATYTEALRHFMEAEAKEPGFWNKNRLMIAKCYIALAQPDEARRWLDSVLKAPVGTSEDADVAKEASALAAKLGK